ncbi:MAG: methyltransferase domain-containing protein, partial [Rhodospirillaceae bacterium]
YLHRGEAASFCLYHAKVYCRGLGVDVGAGRWPFPGAHAVEDGPGENAYRLKAADVSQDYVFSSHCLEHLERWREALLEWTRVLKPGGILYLYLPHPACRMWRTDVLPHHVWQPEPDALPRHLVEIGFEIVDASLFPDAYLSFYVVARRL